MIRTASAVDRSLRPGRLTDALASNSIQVRFRELNASTNGRDIPYSEIYRSRAGQLETPIERLQRIANEDEAREAT